MTLAEALPGDFGAPVFVTLHIPSDSPSLLPQLLSRKGKLRAKHPEDGEAYKAGVIYVAPPDQHMLIERNGRLRVVRGPRENRHRPAIDPLFRSAAAAAGPKVIGAILTGTLDDGTAGLRAIKEAGGVAVVQDPADAVYRSMPESALENVDVDYVLPLRDIPKKLSELLGQEPPAQEGSVQSLEAMMMENRFSEMDPDALQGEGRRGHPSAFSCPDCGGVLWEIDEEDYLRFRCRVGHAFSPESMIGAQNDMLEQALWSALKTLEENAHLSKRLADRERQRGHKWMAVRFEEREKDALARAEAIQRVLASSTNEVPQPTEEEVSR